MWQPAPATQGPPGPAARLYGVLLSPGALPRRVSRSAPLTAAVWGNSAGQGLAVGARDLSGMITYRMSILAFHMRTQPLQGSSCPLFQLHACRCARCGAYSKIGLRDLDDRDRCLFCWEIFGSLVPSQNVVSHGASQPHPPSPWGNSMVSHAVHHNGLSTVQFHAGTNLLGWPAVGWWPMKPELDTATEQMDAVSSGASQLHPLRRVFAFVQAWAHCSATSPPHRICNALGCCWRCASARSNHSRRTVPPREVVDPRARRIMPPFGIHFHTRTRPRHPRFATAANLIFVANKALSFPGTSMVNGAAEALTSGSYILPAPLGTRGVVLNENRHWLRHAARTFSAQVAEMSHLLLFPVTEA